MFTIKDQIENILGLMGHMISLRNAQLSHYSAKAAIDVNKLA